MSTLDHATKMTVLSALRARLEMDLTNLTASHRSAQEGATHEENRAEDKKDMRATEVSYLARGLAERVGQLREASAAMATFAPRPFSHGDPIALGALVLAEDDETEETHLYFLTPAGGGLRLEHGAYRIATLTPRSPLGKALMGKVVGDDVSFRSPQGIRYLTLIDIA